MGDRSLDDPKSEEAFIKRQFASDVFVGVPPEVSTVRAGLSLSEREFKVDDIKNIPWKSWPSLSLYKDDDMINCAATLVIAGLHNVQLPLTFIDMADVAISFFMIGAGYYRGKYSMGYEVLCINVVENIFCEPTKYDWRGVKNLKKIAKKNFQAALADAKTIMDLFDVSLINRDKDVMDSAVAELGEQVKTLSLSEQDASTANTAVLTTPTKSSSISTASEMRDLAKKNLIVSLSAEKKRAKKEEKQDDQEQGSSKEVKPITVKEKMDSLRTKGIEFMMLQGRTIDREYTNQRPGETQTYTHEDAVITKIRKLYGRGQLVEAAVMMSYIYVRTITKSTDHVITCGVQFANLANKHHFMLDANVEFTFHRPSVDAIRTHILPFASSIAVFSYMIEKLKEKGSLRCEDLQYTQYKTLVALRLEYFGMTLLALAVGVSEKLRITVEKLCAYSANTFTFESIRTLLDFMSRLKGQPASYAEARNTQRLEKIDPRGIFKYARMLDSNYFLSLSTAKNVHLVFMWVAAQKLMSEGSVSWEIIQKSNVPFKTLNPGTAEFLYRIVECIVSRIDFARTEYVPHEADSIFVPRALESLRTQRGIRAVEESKLSTAAIKLQSDLKRKGSRSRSSSSTRSITPNPTIERHEEEASTDSILQKFDKTPKI